MNAAQQRRREVHDTLLPILAERYGDQVRVLDASNADGNGESHRSLLVRRGQAGEV